MQLDLPDAVYRGYETDEQLLGTPRDDDEPPYELLRQEILRLEPQMVYFPLAVGQPRRPPALPRGRAVDAGRAASLGDAAAGLRRASHVLRGLPVRLVARLHRPGRPSRAAGSTFPRGLDIEARYSDISETTERKAAGLRMYASQITRLFESDQGMLDDLAGYHARVALAGGVGSGAAERYWGVVRP